MLAETELAESTAWSSEGRALSEGPQAEPPPDSANHAYHYMVRHPDSGQVGARIERESVRLSEGSEARGLAPRLVQNQAFLAQTVHQPAGAMGPFTITQVPQLPAAVN